MKEEPTDSEMDVDEGEGKAKVRRSRRTRGGAKKKEQDDDEDEDEICGGAMGVHCLTLQKLPALGDTSDPVPLVSNPVMDTRLGFLGLCQSNKYQVSFGIDGRGARRSWGRQIRSNTLCTHSCKHTHARTV